MPSPLASPFSGTAPAHAHHAQQQHHTDEHRDGAAPGHPPRQASGDSYLAQQQQQQRRTPSPLPPYLQQYQPNQQQSSAHAPHLYDEGSSSSSKTHAAAGDRAQSVPPGWAQPAHVASPVHAASIALQAAKHRASPIDTSAAGLAKRRTVVHLDDATTHKRPMSPHITSATPTSASVRHSALGHHHWSTHHDRQGSLPTGAVSPSGSAFAGTSAISKRDSIHSPLAATAVNAPWLQHTSGDDALVEDDEAGKGHGGRMSVPPVRPDSKPAFPLSISPQPITPSPTNAPATADHSGIAPRTNHPASSALAAATGLGPLYADSPLASTSPIIVPQARRGAINLKKASRTSLGPNGERRKDKQRRRRRRRRDGTAAAAGDDSIADGRHRRIGSNETNHSSHSGRYGPYYTSHHHPHHHRRTHTNEAASYPLSHRPALSSMRSIATILLWNTFQALVHPRTTAVRIGRWFMRTCREVDDAFRDPRTRRRTWKPEWLDAYVPFLIWLAVSLSSTGTVIIFHTRVFTALDELSQTLQRLGLGGQFVMGGLIFLTTFPPMPLYSTLVVLCGFSFGMIEGFIIAYIAALSGAITVFLLSRTLLRGWMSGLLNKSGGLKKVVRAIEKQPKLLFLIRLAPYPYNLMNTLLASSPTLTFKTYTMCTALALPKLLVHTGLGTSIKNFAAYHGADGSQAGSGTLEESEEEKARSATAERVKRIAGLVGVLLCIGIFFYLMHVARKAVDNLDDEAEDGLAEKEAARGAGGGAQAGSSSRRRVETSSNATEAERQRLYSEGDYDDDFDEDGSAYTDDSDFYSDDDLDDDYDEADHLPALDGGHAGDDSLIADSSSSHHKRPSYGRMPTSDGAELDMRETGYDRRHAQWSSAGPSQQTGGGGGGGGGSIVGRVKAGLGLGSSSSSSSSTRYAPIPGSAGPERSGSAGATAVQMSVVSSVSTPLTSVPSSLANGTVSGGRRAVVAPGGPGAGLLGAKPRASGVGERSAAFVVSPPPSSLESSGAGGSAATAAAAGSNLGGGARRSFPPPRLGPGMLAPAAGGYGSPSLLSPIVGTPGGALSSAGHFDAGPVTPLGSGPNGGAVEDGDPDGLAMSMVDRIAEMEASAEEYFTSAGPRWGGAGAGPAAGAGAGHDPSSAAAAAAEGQNLRGLAQQQRRAGPRSASEMGFEEATYGH